jgi:hypothetical protein
MKRAPSSARLELSMPPPSRQLSLRPVLGIDEACAAVERAGTIDEVGDALVDFLPSHFRVGLVLVVRGELLHGFRGFAPFVDPDVIKRLSLPLASTHLSRAPWACAPGPDPLYRLIGCDAPDVAVAMPIAIASRTVNIVYGHGERGAILPRWAVDDLRRICEVASAAYARITRVRAVASR